MRPISGFTADELHQRKLKYEAHYRENNRQKLRDYQNARALRYVHFWQGFMSLCSCEWCGYVGAALEWHHRVPQDKDYNIACIVRGKPVPQVLVELDKCQCLCANCHAEFHAADRQKRSQKS